MSSQSSIPKPPTLQRLFELAAKIRENGDSRPTGGGHTAEMKKRLKAIKRKPIGSIARRKAPPQTRACALAGCGNALTGKRAKDVRAKYCSGRCRVKQADIERSGKKRR